MSILTEQERDELLIRIDERTKALHDKFDGMSDRQDSMEDEMRSDIGFTRCQMHTNDIKDLKNSMTWFKRMLVASVVGLVLAQVLSKFI